MRFTLLCAAALMVGGLVSAKEVQVSNANLFDHQLAKSFEACEKDWRNGAIVHQVLPDCFAPSDHLEEAKGLNPAPKVLRRWDELPTRGTYLESARVWNHEIDFRRGDLQSLVNKLDYAQISPEIGTRADVKNLPMDLHRRGMKQVLDGVSNHMARKSPKFVDAMRTTTSPNCVWFYIGPHYPGGASTWCLAENLPELNLENSRMHAYVYAARNSVARNFLRDGVDGWRFDVVVDIGFNSPDGLICAAHAQKPGSLVSAIPIEHKTLC